ncbi:MAG: catalase family protein [Bacteriovoracaceae bacterium]|nr:catalase family protein [Bacteriovoracaceae bacterium]
MKKIVTLTLITLLSSCASNKETDRGPGSVSMQTLNEPTIDVALNEEYEPNEDQAIQNVIHEAMVALKRDYHPPHVPRDAHAKSHGCLQASFTVKNQNLPADLRVGVFKENKSYPTWVRFSNNTSDPMSHDKDLDLRGIAIKVMYVNGKKLMTREEDELTQDFLMFASPIFFVKDIKDYSEFIKALGDGRAFQDLLTRPRSLVQLATAQLKAKSKKNPLKLTYFSATPYCLGLKNNPAKRPVKYSVTACDAEATRLAPNGDSSRPNFMREALVQSLNQKDACFNFQVQLGDAKEPAVYPVEDPSVLWPEKGSLLHPNRFSPYVTVATLRIPKQIFDNPERDQFCEHLSFTPWHALPEHRPLGRTNRMRLKLYEAISSYRHKSNGVERREPKTLDPKTAYPNQ